VGGHRQIGGLRVAGLKRVENRLMLEGRRDDPLRLALQSDTTRESLSPCISAANVPETLAQEAGIRNGREVRSRNHRRMRA
jgi:hypothetical protein